MSNLEFHQFSCRGDNFCVLVHDPDTGNCVSIDAPQSPPIISALEEKNWKLSHIFVTHWHLDHVDGIPALKEKYGCKIVGPCAEKDKISGLDQCLNDGDELMFGNETVEIISTPGHTLGMINFYFPKSGVVFTGDTLFALGCGRVFEGNGTMMWRSMQKLAALPPETQVYCGHEYTLANGRFALGIDASNTTLNERMKKIEQLREKDLPTLPTTIGEELESNPFLRPDNINIRKFLNMENASDVEVFTEIRRLKDNA